MYEDVFTGETFNTIDEVKDYLLERIDEVDILNVAESAFGVDKLVEELLRLKSPLYDKIVDKALDWAFDDYIREVEQEEE